MIIKLQWGLINDWFSFIQTDSDSDKIHIQLTVNLRNDVNQKLSELFSKNDLTPKDFDWYMLDLNLNGTAT